MVQLRHLGRGLGVLAALSSALIVVGLLVATVVVSGPALPGGLEPFLIATMFALAGCYLAARLPRNAIGWLLLASAVCIGGQEWANAVFTATEDAATAGNSSALGMWWLSTWLWVPAIVLIPVFGFLLFPNGRLPSRRWRPLLWAGFVGLAMWLTHWWTISWHGPEDFGFPPSVENPLHSAALDAVRPVLAGVGFGLLVVVALGGVVSLVLRYRRSHGDERQQLRWVAWGTVVVVIAHALDGPLTRLPFVTASTVRLSLAVFPLTIAVAILKYRLYDIDRIISRTVSYALLSALLVAVYLGAVFSLQQLLSPVTGESDIAVAGATLAVAAVFGPARRRLQAVVDRRFNRARYDAQRIVEAFRARMRDEVDLDQLGHELVGAVRTTVEPAQVSLWLASRGVRR